MFTKWYNLHVYGKWFCWRRFHHVNKYSWKKTTCIFRFVSWCGRCWQGYSRGHQIVGKRSSRHATQRCLGHGRWRLHRLCGTLSKNGHNLILVFVSKSKSLNLTPIPHHSSKWICEKLSTIINLFHTVLRKMITKTQKDKHVIGLYKHHNIFL